MQAPILNDAQFDELFQFASTMNRPAMYRLMLLLSIRLGMRPMEIAGLDSSWFRGDELRIPLGYSKRKSGRTLPVNDELKEALFVHMQGRTGQVFLNHSGKPFTARGISEALVRLYRLAGFEAGSCYSGRRTLATNLVDKGVSIAIVSKILGHSNISTTQNYISVTDNMMSRALFA